MGTDLRAAVRPTCDAVVAVLTGLPGPADPGGTGGPGGADLDARTPCADFDLRSLVEHFVGTSGAMARLGAGEPLDPENPWGGGEGAAETDWAARLRENLDTIGRGWSRAEAWEGEVEVGGSALPRTMLGQMALIEVAAHGWDLARALGRDVELEPAAAAAVQEAVAATADLGRRMGAYGPEVAVGQDATSLERALAQAGRDARWTPDQDR